MLLLRDVFKLLVDIVVEAAHGVRVMLFELVVVDASSHTQPKKS